jgi:hypothetical protein
LKTAPLECRELAVISSIPPWNLAYSSNARELARDDLTVKQDAPAISRSRRTGLIEVSKSLSTQTGEYVAPELN